MLSCKLNEADYHIHPDYSLDATGSIDEYCRRALELGLKEICFTTHYDSDPFRRDIDRFMRIEGRIVPLSEDAVRKYVDEVRGAGEKYRTQGLSVKAGLEVDYAPHIEEQLKKDLAAFDLDYRLGSVHCLEHIAITASGEAGSYFKKKSAREMVSEYYECLRLAVESGLFDVMAHLDIYKKYGLGFYGEPILSSYRGLVEPVLERMAENHLGMEINTGVLRRGHKEFSPCSEILELALSMGVGIVALGSDAHEVNHLGRGIKEAYRLVKRLEGKEDIKGKTVTR